ncbi:hypothetical protein PC116_g10349 [Phytophthora cactorum]|uniref:Uncharacterized protein n=1 Tax=Phytophthora cactorum TaxID=29920 RepID=A0A8T1D1H7_9STRA|nr:hypothetical protein Pcac1_g16469 [Phytophthora cactorum]KAG2901179.1 hypothetical protein PC114_g13280 [Phytophthora cactorum]KAG2933763.1 hypothetical protein PC117_g12794 [Phytophthora cactorum]KAG3195318.1 hypothetical protein PC128_g8590 [Phytophthora cactorum]KAG4053080.1 hypothetical protein PC123_g11776 [Phytophthora cactorum]
MTISSLAEDILFRRSESTSFANEKKRSHSLDVGGKYATSTKCERFTTFRFLNAALTIERFSVALDDDPSRSVA